MKRLPKPSVSVVIGIVVVLGTNNIAKLIHGWSSKNQAGIWLLWVFFWYGFAQVRTFHLIRTRAMDRLKRIGVDK